MVKSLERSESFVPGEIIESRVSQVRKSVFELFDNVTDALIDPRFPNVHLICTRVQELLDIFDFRRIKAERGSNPLKRLIADADRSALLEPSVPCDADISYEGNLFAAQTFHTPARTHWQTDIRWYKALATRSKERGDRHLAIISGDDTRHGCKFDRPRNVPRHRRWTRCAEFGEGVSTVSRQSRSTPLVRTLPRDPKVEKCRFVELRISPRDILHN